MRQGKRRRGKNRRKTTGWNRWLAGLVTAALLLPAGEGFFTRAQGEEKAEALAEAQSETGYRFYVDEMSAASGVIKGDGSEVQEGYRITEIVLPDGTAAAAEEVNYTVSESGDYTFKVTYQNETDSAEPDVKSGDARTQSEEAGAQTEDGQTETSAQAAEAGQAETSAQAAEADQSETSAQTAEAVQSETSAQTAESAAENQVTEEVTLTVTLPESGEEQAEQEEAEAQQTEETTLQADQNLAAKTRALSVPQIESRAISFGGYDYNTQKKWSTSDFTTLMMGRSKAHLDGGLTNPPGDSLIYSGTIHKKDDAANGAMFRFGARTSGETSNGNAYWLQQGLALSNITFDFTRDFALVGELELGGMYQIQEFGNVDIPIDGGVTIAFVPGGNVGEAQKRAQQSYSPAYRLGAYNTLINSVVCEFDTASDHYYSTGDSAKNFEITEDQFKSIGDIQYADTDNPISDLNGENIYNLAKKGDNQGSKYVNVAHIGVSATGGDALASESSPRMSIRGNEKSGLLSYEIRYDSASKTVTFKVTRGSSEYIVSQSVSSLLGRIGSEASNMKLGFTFGAAYTNLHEYLTRGDYFGETNSPGSGQIDIYAKELYVSPNLGRTATKVRWLNSGTDVQSDNSTYNAYTTDGTSKNYTNKALWPVAGDRIYAQLSFKPATNVLPRPGNDTNVNTGKLYVRVKDLKITNDSGNVISGLSLGTPAIYCKKGNNDWWKPGSSDYVTITGSDVTGNNAEVFVRVELKLPDIPGTMDIEKYNISGTVEADYYVGSSKLTYSVPLMNENNNRIPVSRNPKVIDYNGQSFSGSPRVFKAETTLKNVTNAGNKDGAGDTTSLHYGVGYRPFSTGDYYAIYQEGHESDITSVSYQYASMSSLSSVQSSGEIKDNEAHTVTMNPSTDTRYIVSYGIQDSTYASKQQSITNNASRGTTTGKRVIWASDDVQIVNGWEFYALPVTMPKDELTGFGTGSNAVYYQKLLTAASAKIFRTADYNFTNKFSADYHEVKDASNTAAKVQEAINSPGTQVQIPIVVGTGDGDRSYTIRLTVEDNPSIITSTDDANILKEGSAVTAYTHGTPVPGAQNGSFEITGTFKFGGSTDSLEGAQFAVTKQEKGRNDADPTQEVTSGDSSSVIGYGIIHADTNGGLRAELVGGTYFADNMGKLEIKSITGESGNTFTLRFSVKDNGGSISYRWDEGAVYGVHAWGTDNTDAPSDAELQKAGDRSKPAGERTTATKTLFLDPDKDIPGETHEVSVLPKKVRSARKTTIDQIENPDSDLIYPETDFSLSAEFGIDPDYPVSLQIGDTAPEESKVHTAVYKADPGVDAAKGWAFEGQILDDGQGAEGSPENKVDAGSVGMKVEPDGTQSDDTVTVTYDFTDVVTDGDHTITKEWEDGAVYYIVAWNDSNEEGNDFTETNLNPVNGDSRTKAPSVSTGLEMSKIMYSGDGKMYPGDGGTQTEDVTPAETKVYMQEDGKYSLEAAFCMKGDIKQSNNKTAYYVVFAQEPDGDNAAKWGLTEKGSINLEDMTVSDTDRQNNPDSGGIFYGRFEGSKAAVTVAVSDDGSLTDITLKFTGIDEVGRSPMTYRIYMWNAGNGDKALNGIARVYDSGSALEAALPKADYPCNGEKLYVIPRIYSEGATIENRTKGKMFYEDNDLKISGSFVTSGSSVISVNDLLTNTEFISELKIALYKKDPNSDRYQIFAMVSPDGSGNLTGYQADTVTDMKIQADPGNPKGFTVTFTKTNVKHQYDDGASYRIYAWTASNVTDGLPANFGKHGNNSEKFVPAAEIEAITTIPSVETLTTAVLGTEVNSIIHYPKQITMLDNVNSPTDKHIYSANQKITVTPVADSAGTPAETPDPDPGVDVVIQEISDTQKVDAIEISRNTGSNQETIALTCFLGTINTAPAGTQITSDGKVGTLKFASPGNELPLYFRSSTEPDVADGAPFTGTIHFTFSKSAAAGN